MEYPILYQINTRVWLSELKSQLQLIRSITLDDIPDSALDGLAQQGFDWIWLMGIWQTGEIGRQLSRSTPEWRQGYSHILPNLIDDDIPGSCFAIYSYTVHADFGGDPALQRLRHRMRIRGLKLLLDFVPNHTAPDHPWVFQHPEYYIQGSIEDLQREPQNYARVQTLHGPRVLARGRDPYFPGWADTLQLNYANAALQAAMMAELEKISGQCDGLRCDMAMLILPEVFNRTWGLPSQPFWPRAIPRVRQHRPDFCMMAEVYWDLEWELQQQGFDYTYDKRLYDHLRAIAHSSAATSSQPMRDHLRADLSYQNHMVRFLENHDEQRAAVVFSRSGDMRGMPAVHQAAALITFLSPGMRFFHQGQLEGKRIHVPVHLGRGPHEPLDYAVCSFYDTLLHILRSPAARNGNWRLLECQSAWAGNPSVDNLVACQWQSPANDRLWVIVNFAPVQSQAYVRLPLTGDETSASARFILRDPFAGDVFERQGEHLFAQGLYVDLAPFAYHVFNVELLAS